MSAFGLDIGSSTIKVAQVARQGTGYRLLTVGITPTPVAGLESEAEADLANLATVVKKLYQDCRITAKKVVMSVAEGEVFSRVIEFPKMSPDELSQAIPWEAEQFMPVSIDDISLSWDIVGQTTKSTEAEKLRVLVIGATKTLINKYLKVAELANLEPIAIETEIIAATRALIPANFPPTMLVDFGAKTTDISISNHGKVFFTRSIGTAGEAFTRAIAAALAMEFSQAEQYKVAYGLKEGELEGKVKKSLEPIFDLVVGEIRKAIVYWNEKESEKVNNIILSGGSANLPEAATILAKTLGVEVQIADPFKYVSTDEKILSGIRDKFPLFAISIGLAMRGNKCRRRE